MGHDPIGTQRDDKYRIEPAVGLKPLDDVSLDVVGDCEFDQEFIDSTFAESVEMTDETLATEDGRHAARACRPAGRR